MASCAVYVISLYYTWEANLGSAIIPGSNIQITIRLIGEYIKLRVGHVVEGGIAADVDFACQMCDVAFLVIEGVHNNVHFEGFVAAAMYPAVPTYRHFGLLLHAAYHVGHFFDRRQFFVDRATLTALGQSGRINNGSIDVSHLPASAFFDFLCVFYLFEAGTDRRAFKLLEHFRQTFQTVISVLFGRLVLLERGCRLLHAEFHLVFVTLVCFELLVVLSRNVELARVHEQWIRFCFGLWRVVSVHRNVFVEILLIFNRRWSVCQQSQRIILRFLFKVVLICVKLLEFGVGNCQLPLV